MLKPLTPIQQAWVAALRSGKYSQTKNFLQTTEGYCCLGVLCEVAKDFGFKPKRDQDGLLFGQGLNHQGDLMEFIGLNHDLGVIGTTSLVRLNDRCNTTLEEIADIIEWNADILFK